MDLTKKYFNTPRSYGDKDIDGRLFLSAKPKVNVLIIFVHGLYGTVQTDDPSDKSVRLASKLAQTRASHAIAYNSSRDFKFNDELNYVERQKAFTSKTFAQELEDLKRVTEFARNYLNEKFSIKQIKSSFSYMAIP